MLVKLDQLMPLLQTLATLPDTLAALGQKGPALIQFNEVLRLQPTFGAARVRPCGRAVGVGGAGGCVLCGASR